MKQLNDEDIPVAKLKGILSKLKNIKNDNITYNDLLRYVKDAIYGEKPKIVFTVDAWYKMNEYVRSYDKEIGWHGVVERDGNTFKITDVLLYPQLVTATTVISDETRMPEWAIAHKDITSQIRFQGHSHVNMGVSPSGTDITDQKEWLSWVDDFYIFMIINKKGDLYSIIYDKTNNLVYDKEDISVEILSNSIDMDVNAEIDDNVKVKTYTSTTTYPKTSTQTKKPEEPLVTVYYKDGKAVEDAVDALVKEEKKKK